ncbi:MAG: DUF1648 domain-containing protein [Oscillospiraceae bacterium]|nr:DUF1648 domain-containing protein [Oscillospiraceae bacterium]
MHIPSRAEVDLYCGSPTTRWQRALGIAAPALLLATVVFVLIRFRSLPEQVPTHYNFAGEVDGYSGRLTLLLMPLFGLLTDAVIALTGRFPKSWNTGVRLTAINRVRVYRLVRDLMAELRLGMAILFGGFAVYQALAPKHFSGLVFPLLMVPLLLPLIRYFVRLPKAR